MKPRGALIACSVALLVLGAACEPAEHDGSDAGADVLDWPDGLDEPDVPDGSEVPDAPDVPDEPEVTPMSVEEACAADCGQLAFCFGDDYDGCLDACTSWLENDVTARCREKTILLLMCTSALSCTDLEAYWGPDGSHDCMSENQEADRYCL